jgi:penicillin-binding protein 2
MAEYKEKGFRPGDIVGKGGLEQYYDEFLRGRPGYRKVIVDSRGRIQSEIETVQPQAGQDLVSTIDLDLQLAAEISCRAPRPNAAPSSPPTRTRARCW